MFLGVGMLAGSDGIGGIQFNNPAVANVVGVFALAFILFSGGLDTDWRSVRPVLPRAIVLATVGVAVTAFLVGWFAWAALGFAPMEALLLGAIVSSTDAAAVFAIMRSRGVGLKGNLKPLLELESGSNDPMAVFLTVGVLGLIVTPGSSWLTLIPSVVVRMLSGAAVGFVAGLGASRLFNRLRLEHEGLYPVLSMSMVLLTYGLSELLYGNGFLAVYTCGIVLGNSDFLNKRTLMKFHDGLGWLMQILLFLALGLLVFPSRLPAVAVPAMAAAAFLMFVARPTAVYLGLWRSAFSLRERTLVAWTGLRGAVPIVLATYPFMAEYERSETLFNIVFFIVLASVLLQGKTLMLVARWLRVDEPLRARPRNPIAFEKGAGCQNETREIELSPDSVAVGRAVAEVGLPAGVLILLIRRGPGFVVPRGQTLLEAFDTLTLLAKPVDLVAAQARLQTQRGDSALEDDDPVESTVRG
jgi:cell volume regulation protein A